MQQDLIYNMPVHLVAALVKRLAEITVVVVVRGAVLVLAEEIVDNYLGTSMKCLKF